MFCVYLCIEIYNIIWIINLSRSSGKKKNIKKRESRWDIKGTFDNIENVGHFKRRLKVMIWRNLQTTFLFSFSWISIILYQFVALYASILFYLSHNNIKNTLVYERHTYKVTTKIQKIAIL